MASKSTRGVTIDLQVTSRSRSIADIARTIAPSVLRLTSGARGSAVVLAPGRVLTLARNLRGDHPTAVFADGRRVDGRVLGTDPDAGAALLEVDTGDAPPIPWATSAEHPGIGTPVIAVGDPGSGGLRVTAGAVSAGPQRIRGGRGRMIEGLIEHTAPLPRGTGGGPLLDATGSLLGLNALRRDGGLIVALPAATLRPSVEAIAMGNLPRNRRLGVAIASPRASRRLREAVGLEPRDGLLVRAVEDGTPAAIAGLQRGDLIVAAADRPVASPDDLYAALDAAAEALELTIVRGTDDRRLSVALAAAA